MHFCNDVHFLGTSVSLCGRILLNSSTLGRRWLVPISSRLAGACQPGEPCKLCTWLGNLQPTALDKPPKDTVCYFYPPHSLTLGWHCVGPHEFPGCPHCTLNPGLRKKHGIDCKSYTTGIMYICRQLDWLHKLLSPYLNCLILLKNTSAWVDYHIFNVEIGNNYMGKHM